MVVLHPKDLPGEWAVVPAEVAESCTLARRASEGRPRWHVGLVWDELSSQGNRMKHNGEETQQRRSSCQN